MTASSGAGRAAASVGQAAIRLAIRHNAPIALMVFAIIGAAVFADYGVGGDEGTQRNIGFKPLNYIMGDQDALYEDYHRHYGVAFELALAAAERALGLEGDNRAAYLSRHLLTHFFFLVGGLFAWLLAHRMFGNRLLALFAMLIFLLHPRLYAHSFFNSKDLPFLSMFMVCLYLIHRAFRRDAVWAFALCGVGVGLLTNIRILGVMLFAAVLGMLALDLAGAIWRRPSAGLDRTAALRVVANGAAFSLAAALTLYATWPLLWDEPLALTQTFEVMSWHPNVVAELFGGEYVGWPNLPLHYLPTWVAITTPPIALALALVGAASVLYAGAARWRLALGNSPERFGLLIAGCAVAPIIAVVALNSNIYGGWRQMYFIYAPMCMLAALGLRRLLSALDSKPRARIGVCALAALGLAAVAGQMVWLHPYQNEYFSPLANPYDGRIGERYNMDYWDVSRKEALEWLVETYPDERRLIVKTDVASHWDLDRNLFIMPESQRQRVAVRAELPHFHIAETGDDPIWTREVYGSPIVMVLDKRAETEAAYRDAYERALESEPIARALFNVHFVDGDDDGDNARLVYVREPCVAEDTRGRFLLSVFPKSQDDLPEKFRELGHEPLNFDFDLNGAIFDGRCAAIVPMPSYPIAAIQTGQWVYDGEGLWSAPMTYLDPSLADAHRRAHEAARASEPVARANYDIYRDGDRLIYVKETCAAEDTRGRFLLSVFPKSRDDLPEKFRELGHESLNFNFDDYGAAFDGKCVVIRALPDYPIASVETGQWIPGGASLWKSEFAVDNE